MFKVCACIVIHFHDAKLLLSQLPRASVYNGNTLPESTGLSSGDNILFRATSFVYLNQRTNGPVNAHLTFFPVITTTVKPEKGQH